MRYSLLVHNSHSFPAKKVPKISAAQINIGNSIDCMSFIFISFTFIHKSSAHFFRFGEQLFLKLISMGPAHILTKIYSKQFSTLRNVDFTTLSKLLISKTVRTTPIIK